MSGEKKLGNLQYGRLMLTRDSETIHHSHLHGYVSAYATNSITTAELEAQVLEAYINLRNGPKCGSLIVNQDGEMTFEVCAGGIVRLLLPWKTFDMKIETVSGMRPVRELSPVELREYTDIVWKRADAARASVQAKVGNASPSRDENDILNREEQQLWHQLCVEARAKNISIFLALTKTAKEVYKDSFVVGMRCSVCRNAVFPTPSGMVCVNGHGGAEEPGAPEATP